MISLVIGGSGSGKSEFAENWICSLGDNKRIYLAAMEPFGEEAERRIARHRQMRADKGFITVESYRNLKNVNFPTGSNVLLECLSNLTVNELFAVDSGAANGQTESGGQPDQKIQQLQNLESRAIEVQEKIIDGIYYLSKKSEHLCIVSNEIFSDGNCYDQQIEIYIKTLGSINRRLANEADLVVEVVYSIPVIKKRKKGVAI